MEAMDIRRDRAALTFAFLMGTVGTGFGFFAGLQIAPILGTFFIFPGGILIALIFGGIGNAPLGFFFTILLQITWWFFVFMWVKKFIAREPVPNS